MFWSIFLLLFHVFLVFYATSNIFRRIKCIWEWGSRGAGRILLKINKSHFMFSSRFMLFQKIVEKYIFLGDRGGGGGVVKNKNKFILCFKRVNKAK